MGKPKKSAAARPAAEAPPPGNGGLAEDIVALGQAGAANRHRIGRKIVAAVVGDRWPILGAKGSLGDSAVLAGGEAVFAALLEEKDARLRAVGALLLGLGAADPAKTAAKVASHLKTEADEAAKASALLTLGVLATRARSHDHDEVLYKASGDNPEVARKPPPAVRVAATVAIAWSAPLTASGTMGPFLGSQTALRLDPDAMPWNDGDLGGLAKLAEPLVARVDIEAFKAWMTELVRRHPRIEKRGRLAWPNEVSFPYGVLIRRIYAKFARRKEDDVLREELDADQLEAARFALANDMGIGAGASFGIYFPLPRDKGGHDGLASERRYLGIDPAGPLDRRLTLSWRGKEHDYPLWKWFRVLTRGAIEADVLRSAIRSRLQPNEIVDLCRDASFMIYADSDEDSSMGQSPRSKLLAGLLDEVRDRAKAPDVEGIHHVLSILGSDDDDAKDALGESGWFGGPVLPKKGRKSGEKAR